MILTRIVISLILIFTGSTNVSIADQSNTWKPNWLMVSDQAELHRTWKSALVFLPPSMGGASGRLFENESKLHADLLIKLKGKPLPLILFLHACEGLGHHRDDLLNYSQLGFIVIAPDSFAREHRPLGCFEEQETYLQYYDIAVAFQKSELDYAVERIAALPWIDSQNQFLVGSGVGGMIVAHYQGLDFSGHVIEGWGCHHPHNIFNGIWTSPQIPIFSVLSKNDGWYKNVPGFEGDCSQYLEDRRDSISIVLDRPAHYVSWYPGSRATLIKFLTQGLGVDQDPLIDDTPKTLYSSEFSIKLERKWSIDSVYKAAQKHCAKVGKKSHLISNNHFGIYAFDCA